MMPQVDLTSPLVVVAFATIIVKILLQVIEFCKYRRILNKIPGPDGLPFFGVSLDVLKLSVEEHFDYLKNLNFKFPEGIVRVWVGNEATVYVRKPRQIEVVLTNTTQLEKTRVYNYMKIWLGEGLLTSSGPKWYHSRKMITPAFHFGILEKFVEVMDEKANIMNLCLMEEVKNNPEKPVNIYDYAIRCTLDIICETSMGINLDCQRDVNSPYIRAVRKIINNPEFYRVSELLIKRIFEPWLQWDWIYYKTAKGKEFLESVRTLHDFSLEVIRKKRVERETSQNYGPNNETGYGNKNRKAFLDLMLDMSDAEEKLLSDEEIQNHVDTLVFGGHDTTSVAVSWIFFLIAHHPEVQDKLYSEIEDVLSNLSENLTYKDLTKFNYLDLVIKETLRLYPSAPFISRQWADDIEIDGYTIPKGTNVTTCIGLLHRDPEIWSDPEKFVPERFLPENSKERNIYAYIPFSAGPRNCIGKKFAIMTLKIIVINILSIWKLKSARSLEDMQIHCTLTMGPHEGNPLFLTLRK